MANKTHKARKTNIPPSDKRNAFPSLDAEAVSAPLQYVNAIRALPTPDGLVLYCFAASADARRSPKAPKVVAKLLLPTGFVRPALDMIGEQAVTMGVLADVLGGATNEPTNDSTDATPAAK